MIRMISNAVVQVSERPDILVLVTPRRIQVTGIIGDAAIPHAVKERLIGVIVCTLFEGTDIGLPGARVALAEKTIEAAAAAGKPDVAEALRKLAPDGLDCFVFNAGTYKVV